MEPRKAFLASPFSLVLIFFFFTVSLCEGNASREEHRVTPHKVPVVERGQRKILLDTEYGEISSSDIKDGHRIPPYHLQFFTLEPNSLFLPVLLHADMVFYVHTGSGRLTLANEDGSRGINLREGDLFSLREGSVFYIQSNLEADGKKLRIYAMFANTDDSTYDPAIGAYSRINKLVNGFDKKIMQAALKVPEDLIEAITNQTDTPAIVHAVPEKRDTIWELETFFLKNFLSIRSNSKKLKTYNIFDRGPDFKNRNGWTLTVTKKQLKSLKRHNIGFLMVNLTTGSMLAPHWNPRATEIAVVLRGKGMIRVVCGSSNDEKTKCHNMRFKVKQGDVFVVPRFRPMAQMSFSNEPLVFMGFSTAAKENHPQFLAGKGSVLHILDKEILATTFHVSKTTIDHLLASRDDSIIFECNSCAEEEERMMKEEKEEEKREEEEEEKEREEEAEEKERRREEEEEEEARKKEEKRKREEEEARREQEERERRREEEARREREREKEEEEAEREKEREREREREGEEEEEEARRQQEKRERRREEEEERRRREEEEAEWEREQGRRKRERRRREKEREEEEARREQEEGEERRREEEKEEESRGRKGKEEEEEGARRQQEKRERRREAEEERRRREEEKAEWEREQARRKRERRRREEEREEEEARREQEERERRREEEEERRRGEEEEESRGREEEEEEEEGAEREEEGARRQQEKRERRRQKEEARKEEEREREEEEEELKRGGRKRYRRGGEGRSKEEAEWEEEEARKEQEERERRREREKDNNHGKKSRMAKQPEKL